jgi:hypothetical protein
MDKTAIFLTLAFVSLLLSQPSNKKSIWIHSILIPFGMLILVFTGYYINTTEFRAGQALSLSFFPAIICGIILYFGFQKKIQNKTFNFQAVVLALSILAWGLAGYQYYLEYSTSKILDSLYLDGSIENPKSKDEHKNLEWKNVRYYDVVLAIPDDWGYETRDIKEGRVHQILCHSKEKPNIIILQWGVRQCQLFEILDPLIESFNRHKEYEASNFSDYEAAIFAGCQALTCTFSSVAMGEPVYNRVYVWVNDEKAFSIYFSGTIDFLKSIVPLSVEESIKIMSSDES